MKTLVNFEIDPEKLKKFKLALLEKEAKMGPTIRKWIEKMVDEYEIEKSYVPLETK